MSRLADLAAAAALVMCGAPLPSCSTSSPTPFGTDSGGGPAVYETLTVAFSGTGSGTVGIASDGAAADGGSSATCSAQCTESYPSTATANLTATAAADSIFDGWDPATSDPGCPTVSMAKSVTCTAIFQKVTIVPDDAGPGVDAAVADANGGAADASDAGDAGKD